MKGYLEDTCLTSCGWVCGMKNGDHAKALRAHKLMKDSRFYKVVRNLASSKSIDS